VVVVDVTRGAHACAWVGREGDLQLPEDDALTQWRHVDVAKCEARSIVDDIILGPREVEVALHPAAAAAAAAATVEPAVDVALALA
jgi:hypothetical protein